MSAVLSKTGADRASLGALFRLAIAAGVPRAVEIQINRGAPLDGRDAFGRSPLMLAAYRGHLELCRLLPSCGANTALVDDTGRNAVQLAEPRGHALVASLIKGWVETHAVDQPTLPDRGGLLSKPNKDVEVAADAMEAGAEWISAPDIDAPYLPAPAAIAIGCDEPRLVPSGAGKAEAVEPYSLAIEHGEAALLSDTGTDTQTIPSANGEQDGENDGWEPDEDYVLPSTDPAIEAAASAIHLHLAAHRAIVDDADWSDVDVELPVSRGLWARGFREEFDAAHQLNRLLDTAILEGRITTSSIMAFLSNTPSRNPDERLERHLVAALNAIGILVEDDWTFDPSDEPPAASSEVATHRRLISRDVTDFLDDMAAEPFSDLGLIEPAMRRFPPPPSAAEEMRLFLEYQAALDRIVLVASQHPAARAVVTEWLRRVGTGELAVQDLFRHAVEEGDGGEAVQPDLSAYSSAIASLRMLVEAAPAFPTAMQNRNLADGLVAIGLTPVRVLEMAEAVCPHALAARPVARRMLAVRLEASRPGNDPATTYSAGTPVVDAIRQAVEHYLRRRDLIVAVNLRMVVNNLIRRKVSLKDFFPERLPAVKSSHGIQR